MGQYADDKCTLPMCVQHDATEHRCGHLDAVNRTWINLKKLRLAFRSPGSSSITPLRTILFVAQSWSPC
ncbi:hypothetical protein TNCV_1274821 [Trichonephila clavipes]|nr:hypothetical protein TNCV_1274821 [Trichonephila clavipes]